MIAENDEVANTILHRCFA